MSVLKTKLEKLNSCLSKLSIRERILGTLVMLALIYFLGEIFLLTPLEKHRKNIRVESDNAFSQLMVYQAEFNNRVSNVLQDPTLAARNELETLRLKNREIDLHLRNIRQDFHLSQEPALLLQSLLRENTDLQVVEVKKGEAVPFAFPGDVPGSGKAGLVRQSVEIELEGSFMTFLEYLKTIEHSSLHLFWDDLELRVVKHPVSRFVLKVHTLSPAKEIPNA